MHLPALGPSILLALLQSTTLTQALNIPTQPITRSLKSNHRSPNNNINTTTVSTNAGIGENLTVICASHDRTPKAEISKHMEYFRNQQRDGKRPPVVDTWTCLREGCEGGSATWWCNNRIIDQCADEEGKVSGSVYMAGADPSSVRKGGWSVEVW